MVTLFKGHIVVNKLPEVLLPPLSPLALLFYLMNMDSSGHLPWPLPVPAQLSLHLIRRWTHTEISPYSDPQFLELIHLGRSLMFIELWSHFYKTYVSLFLNIRFFSGVSFLFLC